MMNSKIAVFVGREHHYIKLKHLFGDEGLYFYTDNAINIDPPSQFMKGVVNSVHVNDYLLLTRNQIPPEKDILGLDTRVFDNISPYWVMQSTRELSIFGLAFEDFLAHEAPDGVVILHENNFWTKYIAWRCAKDNIPVFAFQEGLLRESDQELLQKQTRSAQYSTRLFVWTEADKLAYIDAGVEEEKIVVTGMTHIHRLAPLHVAEQRAMYGATPIVTYALPLASQYVGNLEQDLAELSNWCNTNKRTLRVRPHPFDYKLSARLLSASYDVDTLPVSLSVQISSAVLVQHSTVGLESSALGTPTYEFSVGGVLHQELPLPKITTYGGLSTLLTPHIPEDTQQWIDTQLAVSDGMSVYKEIEKVLNNE